MVPELLTAYEQSMAYAAAAVALTGALLVARLVRQARHTHKRMVYYPSKLNQYLAEAMQPTLDRYTPTWWTNTHVQIFLTFLVPKPPLQYKRDLLTMSDGGEVALDWAIAAQPLAVDAPIVVVCHGLTGCSDAMRPLCVEALAHGYRPVVFNKRGHGGVTLKTPKLQAFGCVRDLKEAIAHIERSYPLAKLYGIGFSAGSGLLSSYLGETGPESRLDAGVMISPGYNALDLFVGGKINPLYDFLMTFSLKQLLLKHQHELRDVVHVPAALRAKTVKEFDEHVYMKMHGYSDLESYWAHNNPVRDLDRILRPVLCINALDDPVCTKETIPYGEFEKDPLRILIETGTGSHCAFYQGHVRLKSWADAAAMEYLNHVRRYHDIQPKAF